MSKKKLQPAQFPQAIQFMERLINTDLWIKMADELLAAANILEAEVMKYWSQVSIKNGRIIITANRKNVQGPYFLLVAYALENYFKALLVHRNRESLKNRLLCNLPAYLKQHDLVQLARIVKLTLDLSEEELLSRLSRNSTWAARYPVPTGPNALAAIRVFSNGRAYLTAYLGPKDVDRLHILIDRLRQHIIKEIGTTHNEALNSTG